jgi:hypothetical protein
VGIDIRATVAGDDEPAVAGEGGGAAIVTVEPGRWCGSSDAGACGGEGGILLLLAGGGEVEAILIIRGETMADSGPALGTGAASAVLAAVEAGGDIGLLILRMGIETAAGAGDLTCISMLADRTGLEPLPVRARCSCDCGSGC